MKHSKKGLHVGHIIGPGTRHAMVKDMCHDLTWPVYALSAKFEFCNTSTERQLFMSYCTFFYCVYVCGTYKTNVLWSFILRSAKVSENLSIYQFALIVISCHF